MKVHGARTIVLLGMMAKMPVGGVVWQTLHYLLGFRRLGFDVSYVEAHGVAPSMFLGPDDFDGSSKAASFIDGVLRRVDLGAHWAFVALHSDGKCYGKTEAELSDLYDSAELIINLHGGTIPTPEMCDTGRLVYVETDPVVTQIELAHGNRQTAEFLGHHFALFTFGENYGRPGCRLPVDGRFSFKPTRQPVVMDLWEGLDCGPGEAFTTVGNWNQPQRVLSFEGETYTWSKHHEFSRLLDLPSRVDQRLELALGKCDEGERRMLRDRGWSVRDALEVSREPDDYRRYVAGSRGEFTVAKDQNVRFRTGWFSDRSASYLAAGRPVVTQETGFSDRLPTGDGLFAFSTADEAASAIEAINADYPRHRRAARDVAGGSFDSDLVLTRLLDDL